MSDDELADCVAVVDGPGGHRRQLRTRVSGGVVEFDLGQELLPIRRFELLSSAGGESLASADGLFHATDQEFEESFKSKRSRANVPRIDFFAGKQTFDHFQGTLGYRVSAAVVCGYKAVELRDDRYLDEAEKLLLQALIVLPSGDLEKTPRNNREHLQVSVLTCLWHVYLARGNALSFARTLVALRDLVAQRTFQSYFILGFNMGKSLRTLTLLYALAEMKDESARNAKLARQLFQLSAQGATGVLAHFSELGTFHRDVLEGMRLVRREGQIPRSVVDKTLRESLRISADDHPETFSALRENLMDAVEVIRLVDTER